MPSPIGARPDTPNGDDYRRALLLAGSSRDWASNEASYRLQKKTTPFAIAIEAR
ncbi:hypothetical protein [Rhodopirellula bahusiensis]|uniref:hypothetical protein n=1 Tax=Rhodopirellula bahusiensis TaxID=2014065 RepID=UPI003263D995